MLLKRLYLAAAVFALATFIIPPGTARAEGFPTIWQCPGFTLTVAADESEMIAHNGTNTGVFTKYHEAGNTLGRATFWQTIDEPTGVKVQVYIGVSNKAPDRADVYTRTEDRFGHASTPSQFQCNLSMAGE